jgi:hypothetical protein
MNNLDDEVLRMVVEAIEANSPSMLNAAGEVLYSRAALAMSMYAAEQAKQSADMVPEQMPYWQDERGKALDYEAMSKAASEAENRFMNAAMGIQVKHGVDGPKPISSGTYKKLQRGGLTPFEGGIAATVTKL